MFRTIIVGCDGTEREAGAIALALQLRDPDGGRLILVDATFMFHLKSRVPSEVLLERAEANVPFGVPCERRRLIGVSTGAAMNDLAQTSGADLVVLGSARYDPFHGLATAAAAGHLEHGAPCAVAVAARGRHPRLDASSHVAVAYDGSPEADTALEMAYEVARGTGAGVRLCLALEQFEFAAGFTVGPAAGFASAHERAGRAELAAAAGRAPETVDVKQSVVVGSPTEVISEAALGCDLIVTGSRGHGAACRMVVGSTSGGLVRDGRTPLLIIPRAPVVRPLQPARHLAAVGEMTGPSAATSGT
jgi:nucleotide-binding universal stress UspA family protein